MIFSLILDILEALPVFNRLAKYFRKTDQEKAHEVEVDFDRLGDTDVTEQLHKKWTR